MYPVQKVAYDQWNSEHGSSSDQEELELAAAEEEKKDLANDMFYDGKR